jgi:hypothetical protein
LGGRRQPNVAWISRSGRTIYILGEEDVIDIEQDIARPSDDGYHCHRCGRLFRCGDAWWTPPTNNDVKGGPYCSMWCASKEAAQVSSVAKEKP